MWKIIFNTQFFVFLKRMLMILNIVILMLLIFTGCRNPVFQSQWAANPIRIDGENTDWENATLQKIESWNGSMGFYNDDGYLYILIQLENPMLAMRLRSGGITLVFRQQDKEQPILEFHFTGTDTIGSSSEPSDSFWEILNSDQKKRFMTQKGILNNMIMLIKDGQTERIPADGSKGLAAARITRPGFFGFEFKIPILAAQTGISTLGVGSGGSLQMGIRLKAMASQTDMIEGRSRSGTINEGQELWFQITLADNNLAYKWQN